MDKLLLEWGLEKLIPVFEEQCVTLEALTQIFEDNDVISIRTLIPQIGYQALLKKKMLEYLKMEEKSKPPDFTPVTIAAQGVNDNKTTFENSIVKIIQLGTDEVIDETSQLNTSTFENNDSSEIYYIKDSTNPDIDNCAGSADFLLESLSPSSSRLSTNSSNTSLKRKFTDSLNDINIKKILEDNCYGEAILKFYERNKHLTPRYQRYLVDVLITHLVSNRKEFGFLSNSSWDLLSDKIVQLFPLEEKTSYYIPPVKKWQNKFSKSGIARGKLPDKYKNELALLREAGVLPKMESRAETDSCDEFSATEQDDASEAVINSKAWLEYHSEPFEDVLKHWVTTNDFRKNQLASNSALKTVASILNEWPILKHHFGYALIEKDFEIEYPEKENNLFTKFSDVFNAALELKKKNCINTDNEFLVGLLESELSADSRTLIQTYLLCSFLCNKSMKLKKWKPSVAESRESILLQVKTPDQIEEAVNIRREKSKKLGTTLQPFAIAEAPSITKVLASYCYVDGVLYKTNSLLHAIDICFKAFIVFNASYPRESEHIWYLLQMAVYKLETKFDNKIPYVLDFVKLIKKT